MASSSSSCDHINKRYQYDVFLSFSGEDTRRSFVDHLNEALKGHGIRTFKDDERLQKGKEIKEELLKSIDDSRFSVIVFSKKYASSSWCLDELVKIMECHKTTDHTAFPVFYDVEPTEIRKQNGSVGEAFAKLHTKKVAVRRTLTRTLTRTITKKTHARRHHKKKFGKWRKALKDAANLSGWVLKNSVNGHEAKVIKLIVEQVSLELRSINMGADEKLIGMEKRMEALDSYLEIGMDDVRMIGIWGMGGAGKTTLAQAIFDKISINFEGKSFVEDVRENSKAPMCGLKKLQEQVLTDVLKDKGISVSSVHEGRTLIKTMLCGKKVLIVLDDVDHKNQLEALVGEPNWFKPGSRIIITTRDEQVLIAHGIKMIQQVDLLSDEEAIRLFNRHAFGKDKPTREFEKHSQEVVSYASGLPLTIKVLGSDLCGKADSEWEDALKRLKTIPLKETLKILELSYENLEDDYKEIFLDVACFLRGWKKDDAIRILESSEFHAKIGLRVLEQKSLITFTNSYDGSFISMHDHLAEMGMNIVRREHLKEPHKHSRLWVQEEIEHVLTNSSGNEAVTGIQMCITPGMILEGLGNMKNLRCLFVNKEFECNYDNYVMIDEARLQFPGSLRHLIWYNYPHWCLPKTFEANNLVALEMHRSKIEHLWEEGKVMKNLKFLDLSYSKLRSLDLGLTPKLERLNLQECRDLVKLDVDGGGLKSLVYLNLECCNNLKSVSFIKQFESLEVLNMKGLELTEFPGCIVTGHSNNSLLHLDLSLNGDISEIPSSIENLHNPVSLHLSYCERLKRLPGSICSLKHLTTLYLGSTAIEELQEEVGQLECLEYLDLSFSEVLKHLPNSICMLKHLKTLFLMGCHSLEKLPEDVGELESLEVLDLEDCSNLREIPSSICKLKHLKELDLNGCYMIEKLPDELGNLECLQLLGIWDTGITHLPQSLSLIKGLRFERYNSATDSESESE